MRPPAQGILRCALAAGLLTLLSGCITPEYRAAENACKVRLLNELPPEYKTRPVTRVRYEEVPDGDETCTEEVTRDETNPEKVVITKKTSCEQDTKTKEVSYVAIETVDVNRVERDALILECAVQACITSHGNAECKS